jgi:N utilization substance protein B
MTTKKKKPSLPPVKRQIKGSAKARRNSARLAAVQCLYQMRQNGMSAEQALGDYVNNRLGLEEDGTVYVAADTELLRSIVTGAAENAATLAEMLENAMEPSKPLERQEQLIKAILTCAAQELFAHHDTDKALIINGYVEVAKAFYDGREPGLVNAALDSLGRVLRP